MGRSYYDVLGITPTASASLIRAAYKARIREVHPDAGGDSIEASLVNEAYNTLANEGARHTYDRTLADNGTDNEEIAFDSPPAATNAPCAATFKPTKNRTPLWLRGGVARTHLVVLAVWTIAAITLGCLSAGRASALGVPQPQVAGILTAVLPAAIVALILARARLWVIAAAGLGYVIFCASQSVSGYGSVMFIISIAAGITMRLALRSAHKGAAREAVEDFWVACDRPECSGWFIARSIPDRETSLVQLVDVTGHGRPDASALLWGQHTAGSYIVADLSTSPASVLFTVSSAEMAIARKSKS